MDNTNNLADLCLKYDIRIPQNILNNISFNLNNSIHMNNHISFLIEKSNKSILCYGFNYYLKSDKFPFSLHSEINTINKYYKKRLTKPMIKSKKILLIVKVSKTGVIGHSRPCKNCANFILNNYHNINLNKIYYSNKNNILEELSRDNLLYEKFTISSGFRKSYRGSKIE
jgi:hypothetical protein